MQVYPIDVPLWMHMRLLEYRYVALRQRSIFLLPATPFLLLVVFTFVFSVIIREVGNTLDSLEDDLTIGELILALVDQFVVPARVQPEIDHPVAADQPSRLDRQRVGRVGQRPPGDDVGNRAGLEPYLGVDQVVAVDGNRLERRQLRCSASPISGAHPATGPVGQC